MKMVEVGTNPKAGIGAVQVPKSSESRFFRAGSARSNHVETIQEGPQRVGHDDGTIGLLIVLEYGD
jgi:hypothetical protein